VPEGAETKFVTELAHSLHTQDGIPPSYSAERKFFIVELP
jgi:hypothetical protein